MAKFKLNLQPVEFHFEDIHLIINKVENLDELVNQISNDEFNEDERIPYWGELWPSSIALSRFIIKNSELFQKKNILELGCGLGLTSMLIMQQNPASLLCTDYENDALVLARENFQQNKIKQPHFKWLDWRNPQLNEKYELIIASDVLYEERFFQSLMDLFNNYLEYNGHIIIAEPNRKMAIPFFEKLKSFGYQYTIHLEEVDPNGRVIKVSVYLIQKSLSSGQGK